MNNISNLFLGASLFAFALTACAGGDDALPNGAALPTASDDAKSVTPSPSSSEAPPSPTPSVVGAGPDAGTGVPSRTLALQCQGPQAPTSNVICLETAEGRAGEVVDLEVHLLRTAACGPAEYAMGNIQVDSAKFEIVNREYVQDCLSRDQYPSFSDPTLDVITWQAFDKSVAPAECTASAGVGKVDIIKVRIKAGTPAGDYALPFESSELLGGGSACSGVFLDVPGKIRVLP